MNYLGIDIGTSGTKAVCFNEHGQALASATAEYELLTPQNGFAEENPLDWWEACKSVIKEIADQGFQIKGIGLSGQMHGLVLLDKDDHILRNSIIWCDNRAHQQASKIEKELGPIVKRLTGNPVVASFTFAKLLWVKEHEPEIFKKIDKVMLPKDYIRYCLTKEFKTDYSDASGLQLLDIQKKVYAEELLKYLELEEKHFPVLIESQDISGYILPDIASTLGLSKECFVVGGAGDQAAAAIGNGILHPGDVSIVLGSSGVVFTPIEKDNLKSNSQQVFMHAVPNTYHVMGVTNGCGLSYKWWHEQVAKEDYNTLNQLASTIPPLSKGVTYLPYLNGERTPIMDPYASGTWLGIRQNTGIAEMTRAVLEGICYSLKDCFTLLPNRNYEIVISGGGAKSDLWRSILASMLGAQVKRIEQSEGGALGVAILAMVANREYASIEEAIEKIIRIMDVVRPNQEWKEQYDAGYFLFKEAYQGLKQYYKNAFNKGEK